MVDLNDLYEIYRPEIEIKLKQYFDLLIPETFDQIRDMIAYHMGWLGDGAGEDAQGKRIRPLIVLLATQAAGGNWINALPGAAAIEFTHNFSLVHDDIQDNSTHRRGRETMWIKWGIPRAINTGDTLYTLAYLSLTQLNATHDPATILEIATMLQRTCVHLTQGQDLDLSFEQQELVPLEQYWEMIEAKTGALLSCSAEVGALLAGADLSKRQEFASFGRNLGRAFQVVDDWLGVWGDPEVTGKPVGSDLISAKKSLPILYSLHQNKRFAQRWREEIKSSADVIQLTELLKDEGAETFTLQMAQKYTDQALGSLYRAVPAENDYRNALESLALKLTKRRK